MVRTDPSQEVMNTWPSPNFDDPETAGPALNVIAIMFMLFAYLFVGLRIYVRAYLLRTFGIDDWLMVICLVCQPPSRVSNWLANGYNSVASNGLGYSRFYVNIVWLGRSRLGS